MKKILKLNKLNLAIVVLCLLNSNVNAATLNANLNVTANVSNPCTIIATDMNFGYVKLDTGAKSSSTIRINCNVGVNAYLRLDNGLNYSGIRNMSQLIGQNNYYVSYRLFIDSGETQEFVYSSTVGVGGVGLTGTGLDEVIDVYGTIPIQENEPGCLYTDTIQIYLDY